MGQIAWSLTGPWKDLGSRERAQKLQDSGLLEAESGRESSHQVNEVGETPRRLSEVGETPHRLSEVGETQGLGPRLQWGGLGWQSFHSLSQGLDWRAPRAWTSARERSRAITSPPSWGGGPCQPHIEPRSAASPHSCSTDQRRRQELRRWASQDS